MSKRKTRPFKKPPHWDDSPPPAPRAAEKGEPDPEGLSPTRYGDWVKNGVAVDF